VVERLVHTEEVTGSNPVLPINKVPFSSQTYSLVCVRSALFTPVERAKVNNIPPRLAEMEAALGLSVLERYADGWILACEIDQHSHRTLDTRRDIIKKLLWFLRRKCYENCGVMELRAFFAYLTTGHREPGGRWGNPLMTKPVSPRTVKDCLFLDTSTFSPT
jgi:hypothetical protein